MGWKAFFILFLFFHPPAVAQEEEPARYAFQEGEELEYKVKYKWTGFWTTVGIANFKVEKDRNEEEGAFYIFEGKGKTRPFYDNFFKVRDLYLSKASADELLPLRFQRKVKEGKTSYAEDYRFDHEGKWILKERAGKEGTDSIPWEKGVLDVLTAVYYCRSMDLDGMDPGDTVDVRLALGNEVHRTNFVYQGKKEHERPDGERVRCHFIEPELIPGSIFKEGDRMEVLVTDDERKIPVYVDTEIIVGRIQAYLSESKGTRTP